MTTDFIHGVCTLEEDAGTKEVSTVNVSVIGIVGTAYSESGTWAEATTGNILVDNQLLFSGTENGSQWNSYSVTLIEGIEVESPDIVTRDYLKSCIYFAVKADGSVLTIFKLPILSSDKSLFLTAADIYNTLKGEPIEKPAITSAGGDNVTYSICIELPEGTTGTGIVIPSPEIQLTGGTDEPFPSNTPTVITGNSKKIKKLGGVGTLPSALSDIMNQGNALVVVVRVDITQDSAQQQKNVLDGINALTTSGQLTGVTPRIIIAPDFSATDPVAAQIEVVANKLRGVGYIDSPGWATAQDVALRRQSYGARIEILRPRVYTTSNVDTLSRPYSACAAGLRSRIDNENGFWWSKSNQQVYGITSLEQIDDFIIGEKNCTANLLNASQVSTIIRRSGFRHWGNYLCSNDPQWSFECVRRTADVIEDSIAETVQDEFVDRPIDIHLGEDIIETINGFLRKLFELGAINGGKAWLDAELNTAESLAAGKLYINVEFAPKSPAQTITITYRINNDYTVEQFAELLNAA